MSGRARSLLWLAVPVLTGIGAVAATGLPAQPPGGVSHDNPAGAAVELLPIEVSPQEPLQLPPIVPPPVVPPPDEIPADELPSAVPRGRPGHSLPPAVSPAAPSPVPDGMSVPALESDIDPLEPGVLEHLSPWWYDGLTRPLRPDAMPLAVDLETLAWRALEHSPRVLALKIEPLIQRTEILEQAAAFDWRGFVDSNGSALSDPVGNTLTTGGASRFRNRVWVQDAGVRKRNVYGGEIQAFQRIGLQSNNSLFFTPGNQATTRLELRITQPLLGRSGKAYNTSRIALARIDAEAVSAEVAAGLQDHVVAVTEAYWELYRARSVLQQKVRSLGRAEFVLEILEGRRGVDASQRQILRARAAVATRRSELVRARTTIRNTESQLRLLVNDPELMAGAVELLPEEVPRTVPLPLSMPDALTTTLTNRPEIAEAVRRLHAASVKLGVARNEFLPQLDLVLGAYVAGLQGNFNLATSWQNQFTVGQPGYIAGLLFEVPLGRRAGRARVARQEHEYRRAAFELDAVVQRSLTETEIAVRSAKTAYREIVGKLQAMEAAEAEAVYLYDRWRLLAGDEQSTTLLLEDLLDAQERVADEEAAFTTAQTNYAVALVQVQRAMGTLLQTGEHPSEPLVEADTAPAPVNSDGEPAPTRRLHEGQEMPEKMPEVPPSEPGQFGHSIPPLPTPSAPSQPPPSIVPPMEPPILRGPAQ